uniref:Rapunzel n=1 Tax=Oryzias sinensis TaxID=183150 RepID=A0A8C7Y5L5_9TELE
MAVDKAKLQEVAIKGLKVLRSIAQSASTACPALSIASSLIGVLLNFVDHDDSLEKLRKNFQEIHNGLNDLSEQADQVIRNIKKEKSDEQFGEVVDVIKQQYEKYEEMINAPPEEMKSKAEEFKDVCNKTLGDQCLNTLYESVMGKNKMASDPILKVYKEYSGNDRDTMFQLCDELLYLLCIGCVSVIAKANLDGGNEERKWEENLHLACKEIEKALEGCK